MQQTFPQYFTTDPVFEQGFVFLVVNPDADDLTVKILDTKNKDKEVASAVIRVSDIIKKPGMNFEKQPVTLKVGGIVLLAQGWGGLAVQYRQYTPVLVILVTVTYWRSKSRIPVLDRERQSSD